MQFRKTLKHIFPLIEKIHRDFLPILSGSLFGSITNARYMIEKGFTDCHTKESNSWFDESRNTVVVAPPIVHLDKIQLRLDDIDGVRKQSRCKEGDYSGCKQCGYI